MSTGMFHLLPVLKGWQWVQHTFGPVTLQRGATPIQWDVENEFGWLMNLYLICDDCFCRMELEWTGATPKVTTKLSAIVEDFRSSGSFIQDPNSWASRYTRPNATSTAGIYFVVMFSGGFHGSPLPYLDKTKVRLSLDKDGTQNSCSAVAGGAGIQIINMELFIQSLRSVYAIRNMRVDKNLLQYGSQTFAEGLF